MVRPRVTVFKNFQRATWLKSLATFASLTPLLFFLSRTSNLLSLSLTLFLYLPIFLCLFFFSLLTRFILCQLVSFTPRGASLATTKRAPRA